MKREIRRNEFNDIIFKLLLYLILAILNFYFT